MKKFIIGTTLSLVIAASAGLGANVKADTVYRLYNRNTGEHFYTKNTYERSSLIQNGWNNEGVGWYGASSGEPVYRVYNPNSRGGDHYYTMSRYEAQSLVNKGWRWDNNGAPAFYSAGNTKLYVSYNPNAQSGSHNYTTNIYEQNSLLQNGWKYGSVSFYVSSPGGNTPPPTQAVWQGWVKNGAGVVVASQNFSDAKSATTWASKWADEHYYSLIVNGKLGSFGANQIS